MLDLSKNHFELFGLPASYRVDSELLAERFRELQQALHPDRYAAAGDREKRLSMQASTLINEAFQTLRDPLQRARYLLSLNGNAGGADRETTQDMAFLMEQMEMREALAEVRDQPNPVAAIGDILDRLANQARTITQELEARLDKPSAQEDLDAARELVRKLQFVSKCHAEAENLEAELEDLH